MRGFISQGTHPASCHVLNGPTFQFTVNRQFKHPNGTQRSNDSPNLRSTQTLYVTQPMKLSARTYVRCCLMSRCGTEPEATNPGINDHGKSTRPGFFVGGGGELIPVTPSSWRVLSHALSKFPCAWQLTARFCREQLRNLDHAGQTTKRKKIHHFCHLMERNFEQIKGIYWTEPHTKTAHNRKVVFTYRPCF